MSQFRFTINDIDNAVSVVIAEPVGWDGLVLKLQRHPVWHGFFDYFDGSLSVLQFDGEGGDTIKTAYELLGVDAHVELEIEYACAETDAFEPLYTGRFDFATYKYICGDRCYVEINAETTSCLIKFKNRIDQKVDVSSLRTFDLPSGDADDLAAYGGINFKMELLANAIFLRTFYQMTAGNIFYFTDGSDATIGQAYSHYYCFQLDIPVETTLPSFSGVTSNTDVNNAIAPPLPIDYFLGDKTAVNVFQGYPIFELAELSKLACYGDFNIDIHVKGEFIENSNSDRRYQSSFSLLLVEADGTQTFLDTQVVDAIDNYNGGIPNTQAFDITVSLTQALNEGDKLYYYLFFGNYQYFTGTGTDGDPFTLSVEFEIYDFDINGLTACETTEASVCLINETASRVTEIITGDCLRVYSDEYGRTDAEPYTSAADGCGALRVLSNGLWIRQAIQTDDTQPKYMVSMKDIFEGLNAIDCIGMGVEDDPNRLGYQWLRLERFQYFYDTAVLLTCSGIFQTTKELNPSQIFSTFAGGFQKYETETAGGLNDFHTKRNFRTTIAAITNSLNQSCMMIASGHSIEITRWQVGATSQDWRYDDDSFIICVKRDGGSLNGYRVQRGEDMPTADNLPNWETCYNVLISPQRNARRWTPILFQCYVDFENGTAKFMDGDGNLIASTYIEPDDLACITQDDTAPFVNMPENADISLSATADFPFEPTNVSDFYPIFKPELVRFEYPLSFEEWKTIKANPYGLIQYQCGNGDVETGWISELNYRLTEGIAEFILIPQQPEKIEAQYGG